MLFRRLPSLIFASASVLAAGVVAVGVALPVLGQQGPESLLPPGFNDPAPATPPPASNPAPSNNPATQAPSSTSGSRPSSGKSSSVSTSSAEKKADEDEEDEEETVIRYDVPPTARRSLKQIGVISAASGGFAADAFGGMDGVFLNNVLRNTNGPLASRWGMIMARRLLISRTNTPDNVDGADWAAERSWLLLRMGDALSARQLVQQVDSDRYSKRLYEVAMPVFLANGDLSGMCPTADEGAKQTSAPTWRMAIPICSSLAGEQGRATALLNQGRNKGWAKGIDLLLTEKAVGAGTNGRRAVSVKWEKVVSFNVWRHGLAVATGLEAPERLYDLMGRHVDGWRAQLPMISAKTRVLVAPQAAALGTLSSRAMVDAYSLAAEDPELDDAAQAKTELLGDAYRAGDDAGRIAAMNSLWNGAKGKDEFHGMLVLTARAAALIAPGSADAATADRLIASMMTAGFDNQAAAWGGSVDQGSLGWGVLAAGAPSWKGTVDYGALDDFRDNDTSENYQKTALLTAALAGLGRSSPEAMGDMAESLERNLAKQNSWSKAINAAAERGESGTVVLLAAAGLQARDWSRVPAHHLYHIVRALKRVGLESEARMIGAEAVSLG
jgi:hypothetical protein